MTSASTSDTLQLRDIHVPDPIGWWPPAPGWWLLLLLTVVAVVALVWWWQQYRKRTIRVQTALTELDRIEQAYQGDKQQLVRELSGVLRRIAISFYGRQRVAGLSGERWLRFLDKQGLDKQGDTSPAIFTRQFQTELTELPYRRVDDADVKQLIQAIRRWTKQQGGRHV